MPGIKNGLAYVGIWLACSSIVLVAANPQNSSQKSLVFTRRINESGSSGNGQDQHSPIDIIIGGKNETHHQGSIEKEEETNLSEIMRNSSMIDDQYNNFAAVVDGFKEESSKIIDRCETPTNGSTATTEELRSSFDQMSERIASIDRSLAGIAELTNKTLVRSEEMSSAHTSMSIELDGIKSLLRSILPPSDCWEIYQSGYIVSGIHKIASFVPPAYGFSVYCEMEAHGGGWTVLQNRMNGSVDFNQPWSEYKYGFGSLDGEFWLGLEPIYQLTNGKRYELLIELEDFDGETRFALYDNFVVSPENKKYSMQKLGNYTGTAGDSLSDHVGSKFSTWDQDNAGDSNADCALMRGGGWWFCCESCGHSILNGDYRSESFFWGIEWDAWRGWEYSYKKSRMSIRPWKR